MTVKLWDSSAPSVPFLRTEAISYAALKLRGIRECLQQPDDLPKLP